MSFDQNITPNSGQPDTNLKQIHITIAPDGTLNYSFSNNCNLAETLGAFIIASYGFLQKNFATQQSSETVSEQVNTSPSPSVQPLFKPFDDLLQDLEAFKSRN